MFPWLWGKDLWPPKSPDLNPMDYSKMWSILKKEVQGKRYAAVEAFKEAPTRAWVEITVEHRVSIINIRKRVRKSIEAKGGNFGHLLNFFLFNVIDIDLINVIIHLIVSIHLCIRFFMLLKCLKIFREISSHPVIFAF